MRVKRYISTLPNNVLLIRHQIALEMLTQAAKDLDALLNVFTPQDPRIELRLTEMKHFLNDSKDPTVTGWADD